MKKRKILPLAWLVIALALAAALHRWLPVTRWLEAPWTRVGLAPLMLGLWMTSVSGWSFIRAKTGLLPFDEATALVTSGFFRYTRNPMYLGMALVIAGVAVLLGTAGAMLPLPLFIFVIQRNFIVPEEAFMEEAFGEEYRAYLDQVRRWL